MVNHSLTDASALSAEYNGTGSYNNSLNIHMDHGYNLIEIYSLSMVILFIFIILVSCVGVLGNGMVIWLLLFHIKRNPFTTYVLNLAMADFGLVTTLIITIVMIFLPDIFYVHVTYISNNLLPFMSISQFSASQYFLIIISIDRCLSVFFPIWYRCHRPTKLSPIICALIWVISFLPCSVCLIFDICTFYYVSITQLSGNGLFCFPFMVISNLLLFIKVYCKSKQQKRKKLLISILVAVSCFCFLSLPLDIINMINVFYNINFILYFAAMFCACLNSSVNPIIYYLVGRPKKGRSNKSVKLVLQKLFKEEEI